MKIDVKKTMPSYRASVGRFDDVSVPPLRYLMIDGSGDPNTDTAYAEAIAAIYPVAYALKFASKKGRDVDYVVPPLEALWWAADMSSFTVNRDASQWEWTLMSLVPEWLSSDDVDRALARTAERKNAPAALPLIRAEVLDEGTVVQTLHVGPFEDEGPVLAELHDRIVPERGYRLAGRHHEIYFSDPRTTAPEKRRTLLRQPVVAASATEDD
jgi:hypothetical protein